MGKSEVMIVANGSPISSKITNCVFNEKTRKWEVMFQSGRIYQYNQKSLSVLSNPTMLNPAYYDIRVNNIPCKDVKSIYSFKDGGKEYWRLCFSNGNRQEYSTKYLQVVRSIFRYPEAKKVFDYLYEISECISVRSEDVAILPLQYQKIDWIDDRNVAAVYLHSEYYSNRGGVDVSNLIFPFGCNESQMKAVQNALSNRISIIEGPPGTGKTQTILNIIANLVVLEKSVQVVSNNNSAIDNIIEKMALPQYEIDFIAALLGRKEKKQDFLNKQTGKYPDFISQSGESDLQELRLKIQGRAAQMQEIFEWKNHLAKLEKLRYDIRLEQSYYAKMCCSSVAIFRKNISYENQMKFWQEYQYVAESIEEKGILQRAMFAIYCLKWFFIYGTNFATIIRKSPAIIINQLQAAYYEKRLIEIDTEILELKNKMNAINADILMTEFTEMSLKYFRAKLAEIYRHQKKREIFSETDLWKKPDLFLKEYPVVLSTTYTARSSLGKYAKFDYVIMDEASQVDIATGMLAFSCAQNAVIVGDTKQLPHVVTSK